MAITKDIKRRIKSIGSTKKVTKAMEMVSAAKMRRAVGNVLSTRSYATLAWDLVRNLASFTESRYHPLLDHPQDIKKVAVIDRESFSVLGPVFSKECVVVWGE